MVEEQDYDSFEDFDDFENSDISFDLGSVPDVGIISENSIVEIEYSEFTRNKETDSIKHTDKSGGEYAMAIIKPTGENFIEFTEFIRIPSSQNDKRAYMKLKNLCSFFRIDPKNFSLTKILNKKFYAKIGVRKNPNGENINFIKEHVRISDSFED